MKTFLRSLAVAALVAPMFCGLVVAQDDAPATETQAAAPTVTAPATGSVVYVKIEQAPDLEGAVVDLPTVTLTTSFGDVPVPVEKIDGIKMNADSDGTSVVAFKNGDLLTGTISMDTLKLRTNWGTAHIDASAIESVTMTPDGRFFMDNSGGVRSWRFSKVMAEAAPRNSSQIGTPGDAPRGVPSGVAPRQFGG